MLSSPLCTRHPSSILIPVDSSMSEFDGALPGKSGEIGAPDANGLIIHPRDADVLCGRGGAALRHPGNQTYRRLVNLNKGLYITCLKTEKLKISRSIVAAIREQNGRFLEKSNDQNAWYDIGDKKAVEKTSQALREGQPKLRQKIIEMGVAVNPNETSTGVDGNEKGDIVVGVNTYGEAPYGGTMQAQQNMLQQQQQMMRQSNSNMMQQTSANDLSQQQQLLQPHQLAPLSMSSSSINNSQDLHAELLRRLSLHDLQQNISSASFQQQQQLSTSSMQQPPNNFPQQGQSVEQQLLQQQQLLYNQQQQQIRGPTAQQRPFNTRASFARELGISESQLSIMSDFSGYGGGSISGFGSGPINASGHSVLGSTTTSMTDMQALMNIDSSFRNALLGLPIGSIHTAGSSIDPSVIDNTMNTSNSMPNNQAQFLNNATQQQYPQHQQLYQPQQQQQLQQNSYAPMAQHATMAQQPQPQTSVTNAGPTSGAASGLLSGATAMPNNFDRRRVFAKMKYTRPPSVQSVSGGAGVSQSNLPSTGDVGSGAPQRQPLQQQQSGMTMQTMHTTATTEEMNNFHLVDSNGMESSMSLFSTLSTTPLHTATSNNGAQGIVGNNAGYDQNLMQKQQQQQFGSNPSNFPTMNPPSNFTTYDTGFSKVVVETAKVVDRSSGGGGRMNSSSMFNDAMSIGSRQSLMSGLSRISDTSYDNSIFSDLSKKIGNVSTRSMAMSEMSALEIQELSENDDDNNVGEEADDVDDDSALGDLDNYGGEATTNA